MSRITAEPTKEDDPISDFYQWLDKMGNTLPITTEQSRIIYEKLTQPTENSN